MGRRGGRVKKDTGAGGGGVLRLSSEGGGDLNELYKKKRGRR